MSIDIRQICEDDVEAFYAALAVVVREQRYLAFREPPPVEQTRAFVRRNIERGNPQLVVVADGVLVGWCDVTPIERDALAHVGVLGIALIPGYRGKGLGKPLMRAAIAAAWAKGLLKIELGVLTENIRAQALYRKLGFVEEGVRKQRILLEGTLHDEMMMALLKP